ncbi:MAG TPA: hypothetical protein VFU25_01160, partial [Ornithinibacter sp.]|nr:hypothetical protein [Ornithinibacter sp.]
MAASSFAAVGATVPTRKSRAEKVPADLSHPGGAVRGEGEDTAYGRVRTDRTRSETMTQYLLSVWHDRDATP